MVLWKTIYSVTIWPYMVRMSSSMLEHVILFVDMPVVKSYGCKISSFFFRIKALNLIFKQIIHTDPKDLGHKEL